MPYNPHLTLKIEGQTVKGVSTQIKDKGTELLSFDLHANLPFDTKTGTASGRINIAPITITKRMDEDSTILLTAMSQQKKVSGEIHFFRATEKEKDEHYLTVKFDNARITDIAMSPMSDPAVEAVTFGFRTIEVNWLKPSKPFKEDWMVGA